MLLITHNITDPYFNLASEEYFLKEFREEIIYLWRNDNAVIVGKHQNTVEEINEEYVRSKGIKVVRRLTGGGAVFHDMNNVNYTVIVKNGKGLFSNYDYFTKPICGYLRSLGVNAQLNGRNDITIDGLKFSGNAQAVVGERIMHHGTLLFSSDPSGIEGALKPSALKIEGKGVKSVRSRVTNISEHLAGSTCHENMSTEAFMTGLIEYLQHNVEGIQPYELTEQDKKKIGDLVDSRYSTWEWNYGRSPGYTFRNQKKYPFGIVDVRLTVSGGIIKEARIFGDFFSSGDIGEIEKALQGRRHEEDDVRESIAHIDFDRYIKGMTAEEMMELVCSRKSI